MSSEQTSSLGSKITGLLVIMSVALLGTLTYQKVKPHVDAFIEQLRASTDANAPKLLSSEKMIAEKAPRKQKVNVQSWTTAKGARVMFVEADEVPMLDIRLVFNAGAARDGNKPGLAQLTNGMLNEGVEGASVDDIARHFESLGAVFKNGSYRDMAIASLRTLSDKKYRDDALPMFLKVVSHPTMPTDSFERMRQQMLLGLEAENQNPHAVLSREFFNRLYAGHPYSASPNGTEESLKTITLADVASFHTQYYVASNVVIAMTGAINSETAHEISDMVDNALAQGQPAAKLPEPASADKAVDEKIKFPSSQTHILVGGLSVDRREPDWAALYVGNEILGGGGFTSRLNQIIRQDNGLAYSVYSNIAPMGQKGPFMMGLQTGNENTEKALVLLRDTFTKFINEGPTQKEVDEVKRNLLGGYPLSTASNSAIVDQLGAMAFYDMPLDYLETFPEKIAAVTVQDIKTAFNKHINRNNLLTLLLGGEN